MTICNRVAVALALIVVFLAGCGSPLNVHRKTSHAITDSNTALGNRVETLESAHPGLSGCYLLSSGYDAFVARAVFINAAESSIDAQQFIFKDDIIGNLILERLFAAADRGVRVRLLLDDWEQFGKDKRLAGISAHKNIEVRLFNPVGGWRSNPLTRPAAYIFGSPRIKSRMHNKLMVIDNAIAFVGGRDIADEYYYAREDFNFHDLDIMAVGPAAHQASEAFDVYWNSTLAVPISAFVSDKRSAAALEDIREKFKKTAAKNKQSKYIKKLDESELLAELHEGKVPLIWCDAKFFADNPAKIFTPLKQNQDRIVIKLENMINSAQKECLITTPYYVPGKAAIARLKPLHARGVEIKFLSNSLASTDVVCTYRGYCRYRKTLLADDIELYEIIPEHEVVATRAALHAKYVIVDRQKVYVGSLNLDRRSMQLNTEDGIMAESPELGEKAGSIFDKVISANYSYRVIEGKNHKPIWIENRDGRIIEYRTEPQTTLYRRFQSWLASIYIPERWL